MVIIPKLSLDNDLAEKLAEMAELHGVPLDRMVRIAIARQYADFKTWRNTSMPNLNVPSGRILDDDIPF